MLDAFDKTTRRGRARRLTASVLLGLLCAQALQALDITREVAAIPVAALVASVLMLPRRSH